MELECVCGEVLKGKKDGEGKYIEGSLAEEYQSHMIRDDHKPTPGQWATAHEKIEAGKEKAKSRQ